MCGIAGIVRLSNGSLERSTLERMSATLSHRGPDDSGIWLSSTVGLVHRRLEVIDLTPTGRQPMWSCDRSAIVVFNGEIYNFRELKRELQAEGVQFTGNSDTEVVVESYRVWGDKFLSRLNGMFSIAIFDVLRERVLLARDRFGIKPLYYAISSGTFIFASEVKALCASQLLETELNDQAVAEYFHYGSSLGATTFFKGVSQLQPGHTITVDNEVISHEIYADLVPRMGNNDTIEKAAPYAQSLLRQSVERQIVADVPVGIFLSGGLDSSCIAAMAHECTNQQLKTFTATFEFERDDTDRRLARAVADNLGTEHHELHIRANDLGAIFEALVRSHDEPFGDAAAVPLYLMCRELDGYPKVILQGDGGDELFAGYPRYSRLSNAALYKYLSRAALLLRRLTPKRTKLYRALRSFHAIGGSPEELIMAILMSQEQIGDNHDGIFSTDYIRTLKKHDPFVRYKELYGKVKQHDLVQRMLYTDVSIILPDVFFQKVDRASMANGIEVRVPMMDNELVEYILSVPSGTKLARGEKKAILKRILKETVVADVVNQRKRGLTVPINEWLRGPLLELLQDTLLSRSVKDSGIFDINELTNRIDDHRTRKADYGPLLYKVLSFVVWHRMYGL